MQEEVDPSSLQDLLENALDPILVTIGNKPVMANAPALALTGYDRDEILRLSLDDLIHPDERNRSPALHHRGEPGWPAPGSFHTVLVCQDGSLRPVEVSALKTTFNGRPAAFLVLRDTSRRTDEIAHLREIEQNLRFLIENTIDGILVASEEGRYVFAVDDLPEP
jgi:PAS domain S-box-containing protein